MAMLNSQLVYIYKYPDGIYIYTYHDQQIDMLSRLSIYIIYDISNYSRGYHEMKCKNTSIRRKLVPPQFCLLVSKPHELARYIYHKP